MASVDTGHRAEQVAADYLTADGYEILEMNYRRPHCEIDIVARRESCVYFVEVKYRARSDWGKGMEYITEAKLRHMRRAAETWVRDYCWRGEYALSAIEVAGANFEVQGFVESIY